MGKIKENEHNKLAIVEKGDVVQKLNAVLDKVASEKEQGCDLAALIKQRDDVLAKVREIETACEGIENENNAREVNALEMQHAQLNAKRKDLMGKVSVLDAQLKSISDEITSLSGKGIDKILEAIKNQRWYFFKNKTKVLMDRDTGLLWANLQMFPYRKENGEYYCDDFAKLTNDYDFEIEGFRIPSHLELWDLLKDKTFCFKEGSYYYIMNRAYWGAVYNNCLGAVWLGDMSTFNDRHSGNLLPCSDILVKGTDYAKNVAADNRNYTEDERAKFTLDLFVNNGLQPIFKSYDDETDEEVDDIEATTLFRKIYIEKPQLMAQLQELQGQIESLQTVTLLSSDFDYMTLLVKYDLASIDASVIKYYKAVQQWCDELLDKVEYYENANKGMIEDFNTLSVKLADKYEDNNKLTEEENNLLRTWQESLYKKLNLGFDSVKNKLLSVHNEADRLEDRLEKIDEGTEPLKDMAELEKEPRASFKFVAENTSKIIVSALTKLDYFQAHRKEFNFIIDKLKKWQDSYIDFKTADYEKLHNSCVESDVDDVIWQKWYEDWQKQRYEIEKVFLPLAEYALEGKFHSVVNKDESPVLEQIFALLEEFKNNLEKVYLEDRKYTYFDNESSELKDKIEWEKRLYDITIEIQEKSTKVIFQCADSEDRLFIARILHSLANYPLNDIVICVQENFEKDAMKEILQGFVELKKHVYEVYLNDIDGYEKSVKQRDREFTDLLRKLRKGMNI